MIENYLCEIGLNINEAKVFLELSKIGPQAASVVSKRLNINRSSLYSILESLSNKGLISYIDKEKVRVFSANDPNSLIAFIDKQSSRYEFYRSQTLSLIPKLRSFQSLYDFKKTKFQVLDGMHSLKCNFARILNDSNTLTVFFPDSGEDYLFSLFLSVLKNLHKKIKFILPRKFVSHIKALKFPCEAHFYDGDSSLPDINHLIALFDEKICFINFEKNSESMLLIEEKGFHLTLKTLFNFHCKKTEKLVV